ncbi:MAG: tRNA (guanosine(46)-N7)-methyltransferase TrmB [Bacteroidia bacterium]|nr:tRNA (guanosine(46)-N7)-methyltransferase TrmB [Bacteroidia bacterium]HQU99906.1 tRNA (guanosine(46)-N7)-methyltransferase TrmB [Bacteroidia bacterium]
MGKDKLRRWAELLTFKNVFQPELSYPMQSHALQGHWHEVFGNKNPIVIELGCGRGEYTIGLAKANPDKNFIGIDIKGARLWRGAKTANDAGMANVAFLRIRIEFIHAFFAASEIAEIWITFPDPQLKDNREHRRLTHQRFLEVYKQMLMPKGIIHLKSDSAELYDFTIQNLQTQAGKLLVCTPDLYNEKKLNELQQIRTTYENIFLKAGKKITYIQFQFDNL